MRDKYKERIRIEKMRMLNEILSAKQPKEKRAVITRFNPYFYLMFHEGVKVYEPNEDDETAEVALRLGSGRNDVANTQERTY
jgi:hypothetical protein